MILDCIADLHKTAACCIYCCFLSDCWFDSPVWWWTCWLAGFLLFSNFPPFFTFPPLPPSRPPLPPSRPPLAPSFLHLGPSPSQLRPITTAIRHLGRHYPTPNRGEPTAPTITSSGALAASWQQTSLLLMGLSTISHRILMSLLS